MIVLIIIMIPLCLFFFLFFYWLGMQTARAAHEIWDIQKLLDDYVARLKDKTQLRQVGQWVEITTPYLDRHNDYIQIYACKSNGGYTLTDDGCTIGDLEEAGCKLNSPKRQELLKMTLNGFGVQLTGQRLEVHASPDNFVLRKHTLVQAILAVNGLAADKEVYDECTDDGAQLTAAQDGVVAEVAAEVVADVISAARAHPGWPDDPVYGAGILCEGAGEAMAEARALACGRGDVGRFRYQLTHVGATAVRALFTMQAKGDGDDA